MDLITQLQNRTQRRVRFTVRVDGEIVSLRLPDLPPGKTRNVKLSRILRFCWNHPVPDRRICVLVNDWFTGIELDVRHLLEYTRIIFEHEPPDQVFCVHGLPENGSTDYLLRHQFLGFMRNACWDRRPLVLIERADSRLATKLRPIATPAKKGGNGEEEEKNNYERQRKKTDQKHSSSTYDHSNDSSPRTSANEVCSEEDMQLGDGLNIIKTTINLPEAPSTPPVIGGHEMEDDSNPHHSLRRGLYTNIHNHQALVSIPVFLLLFALSLILFVRLSFG